MASNSPVFNVIDLENWSRNEYFNHYYHRVKCTYSVTADIDIGALLVLCKAKSIKLYPAMIHMITTTVNQIDELRISFNEQGQLGMWNYLSPCYTLFHQDDKSFTNIWTRYERDFSVFNHDYLDDINQYGDIKKFIAKENEPLNTFPISCIPWISFTGFNLNIYDDAKYLCPIFTIGKYYQRDNRTIIPVSVQLHHALCDGYHAGLIFQTLENLASAPEKWITA